jgi:autotransporter adhesin
MFTSKKMIGMLFAGSAIALPLALTSTPAVAGEVCEVNGTNAGDGSVVDPGGGMACGGSAHSVGEDSIAIGQSVNAVGSNSIVLGMGANVSGDYSIVIDTAHTGSVRSTGASGVNDIAMGDGVQMDSNHGVGIGDDIVTGGSGVVAIGSSLSVLNGAVLAIGTLTSADGAGAMALGTQSHATGLSALAIGDNANALQNNSTAIGKNSGAGGDDSTALGASAHADTAGSVALGAFSHAEGANSTAIGGGATASADNSVALGQNSKTTEANTVSVGSAGSERRVTNVAAGVNATDAVNKAQLDAAIAGISAFDPAILQGQIDGLVAGARHDRLEARRGVAAAVAMSEAPMPSVDGGISYSLHGSAYRGQYALGGSMKYRINRSAAVIMTRHIASASAASFDRG